jgi:hypothetical protein
MPQPPTPPTGLEFPDPRAVIAADAARYRSLPAAERWRELFAIRRWGDRQARDPRRRATVERLWEEEESRWRRIHQALIARHAS